VFSASPPSPGCTGGWGRACERECLRERQRKSVHVSPLLILEQLQARQGPTPERKMAAASAQNGRRAASLVTQPIRAPCASASRGAAADPGPLLLAGRPAHVTRRPGQSPRAVAELSRGGPASPRCGGRRYQETQRPPPRCCGRQPSGGAGPAAAAMDYGEGEGAPPEQG